MTKARPLLASDAGDMAALHAAGFDHPWPKEDMSEHTERDIALGIGAPLQGFVIFRAAADQAELITVTVSQQARRKGYAKALIQAGEKAAVQNGVVVIFLDVAEDNLPAIALYKSLGYEPFGRRPAYYRRAGGRVCALTFRKDCSGRPAR